MITNYSTEIQLFVIICSQTFREVKQMTSCDAFPDIHDKKRSNLVCDKFCLKYQGQEVAEIQHICKKKQKQTAERRSVSKEALRFKGQPVFSE